MSIIKLAVESGTGLRCMEYGILYGAGGWCGHTDDKIVLTGASLPNGHWWWTTETNNLVR